MPLAHRIAPTSTGLSTRRQALSALVGTGATWLFGCSSKSGELSGPLAAPVCGDGFAGGTYLSALPFEDEGNVVLDTPVGEGLDGRLYTDLANLTPEAAIVPTERFYIRTRVPSELDRSAPWVVRVGGLVATPLELPLSEIVSRTQPMGTHVMECSGNGDQARFGLLSAAEWAGVVLWDLVLDRAELLPSATRVLVSGCDRHAQPSLRSVAGASWIFTFEELARTGAFLATEMNGAPLETDHGAPLRLFVPGWYGCTCIKWVDEIKLVGEDEPATSQMIEFASRTMQDGTPALARDYRAANMDHAAMPVRVEKWNIEGRVVYRVLGILWGGSTPTDALAIRFGPDLPFERVSACVKPATNGKQVGVRGQPWTWWSHAWRPERPGRYEIRLKIDDPNVPTRRLDTGYYARSVDVGEV